MKGRVVQLISHAYYLYALCDDGTIWRQKNASSGTWEPIATPGS